MNREKTERDRYGEREREREKERVKEIKRKGHKYREKWERKR